MATIQELTTKLNQALKIKEQIESLEQQLDAILGGTSAPKKKLGRPAGKQKRTMSAAGRASIAAAQKARWAKINGKSSTKASAKVASKKSTPVKAASAKATPKKKVMSPEAKAKIAAAMKARWEAKKKGDTATA